MYVLHTTLICTGANVIHCQQWLHCDYHKALSAFTSSMPVHTTTLQKDTSQEWTCSPIVTF